MTRTRTRTCKNVVYNEDAGSDEDVIGSRRSKTRAYHNTLTRSSRSTRANPQTSIINYHAPSPATPLVKQSQPLNNGTTVDRAVVVKSTPNLNQLPIELLQEVTNYLDSDKDIAAYHMVCRTTYFATGESTFRQRFLRRFDGSDEKTTGALANEYKVRAQIARYYVRFDRGLVEHQAGCLALLRVLITESDARRVTDSTGKSKIVGHNHDFLRAYATQSARKGKSGGTNILDAMCRTETLFVKDKTPKSSNKVASLPLLIQFCLLHLSLDPSVNIHSDKQARDRAARLHHCHEAQGFVYKCPRDEPIYLGSKKQDINVAWLLQVANFFKFHLMKSDSEGIFADRFITLDKSNLPRPWVGKLNNETKELAKQWKGTYCYLSEEELVKARGPGCDMTLIDEIGHDNDGFQDLTLFFDIQDLPELHFPVQAESVLRSMPKGSDKRSVKDFFGLGFDGGRYHFNGRIHALPSQQHIPGFQRITMMKYLPDHEGNYGSGHTQFWAFEGVILPGGQIMLGRWWAPFREDLDDGGSYCGPFIFWAVDDKPGDESVTAETALEFLDSIVASNLW